MAALLNLLNRCYCSEVTPACPLFSEEVSVSSCVEMVLDKTSGCISVSVPCSAGWQSSSGSKLLFLYNFLCAMLYIKDKQEKKSEMLLSPVPSLIPEDEMQ